MRLNKLNFIYPIEAKMYWEKSYFDVCNSDELIVKIPIEKITPQLTTYLCFIDTIIAFIARFYPVSYIYSHAKLWSYIEVIANLGKLEPITLTLISCNEPVIFIRNQYALDFLFRIIGFAVN